MAPDLGAAGIIAVCALSLAALPLFFVLRAVVTQRAEAGTMRAIDARRALDIAGVVILLLGFADAVIALPHARAAPAVPPIAHLVALPLAYITIAVGAATRMISARIASP